MQGSCLSLQIGHMAPMSTCSQLLMDPSDGQGFQIHLTLNAINCQDSPSVTLSSSSPLDSHVICKTSKFSTQCTIHSKVSGCYSLINRHFLSPNGPTHQWSHTMSQPAHKIIPPSWFIDNACQPELSSHHRDPASMFASSTTPDATSSPLPESSTPPQTDTEDTLSIAADPSQAQSSIKHPSQTTQSSLSLDSVIIISPMTSDGPDGSPNTAPQAKKSKTSLTPVS